MERKEDSDDDEYESEYESLNNHPAINSLNSLVLTDPRAGDREGECLRLRSHPFAAGETGRGRRAGRD